METSFTGAPIDAENSEVSVMAVEENSDINITEGSKVSEINESSDDIEGYIEEEKIHKHIQRH